MAQLKGTTHGLMGKYVIPIVEMVEHSMTTNSVIDIGIVPKQVRIRNNRANLKAIEKFKKLAPHGTTQQEAVDLLLGVKQNPSGLVAIQFGVIEKPSDHWTKGDVAEGVIAAAIGARFAYKGRPIREQNVYGIIRKLAQKPPKNYPTKKGKYVEEFFNSPNADPKIWDKVKVYVSLAAGNMRVLLDRKEEPLLKPYVRSAVQYVNSPNPTSWAREVYENNRVDYIEVISDGLGGQRTTKVDTMVKITNDKGKPVPVDINLSLKVDDIKQFGQVSGVGFDVQKELWKRMFGYGSEIQPMEKKYNTLLQVQKKYTEAVNMVYKKVDKLVTAQLESNPQQVVSNISNGLTYFATLHDPNVQMLNLGKGGTKLYSFHQTYEALRGITNWKTDLKVQKNGYYTLVIKSGKRTLVQIRIRPGVKSDGTPYIRNLIEKGPLMGDLLAETIT